MIKLNVASVSNILLNEAKKFNYQWLEKMEFTHKYVTRFMLENDLMFSKQKSDQSYIPEDQMDIHRNVI